MNGCPSAIWFRSSSTCSGAGDRFRRSQRGGRRRMRLSSLLAAQDDVLLTLLGAGVVVIAVLEVGNGVVRLLDVADDLVIQLLPHRSLRSGHLLGVGVLGF